jgi:hypothetical protein
MKNENGLIMVNFSEAVLNSEIITCFYDKVSEIFTFLSIKKIIPILLNAKKIDIIFLRKTYKTKNIFHLQLRYL